MTEGLTFRGKLTLEDVLDMQHYRALAALRRPVRLLIGLVAMPIALLAAHDLYSHGLVARNSYGLTPLSLLGLSCYALGGWSLIQRSAVRNYYLHHRDLLRSHRCGELRCACHRCRQLTSAQRLQRTRLP